jgi:DNA-binding response OmpR family regulator
VDGLTATAAIRRQEAPDHRAFIVALTADVSAEQRTRCREAGMDEFLEKPLRLQTLAELLSRHLRRGHEASTPDAHALQSVTAATPLELLEADIGPEVTLDLVREYLSGAEQAIEHLSRPDRFDPVSFRSTAHRLLGGARVLGLSRFERIWGSLSNSPEGAAPTMPSTALNELRGACTELVSWIDSQQRKQHA